MALRVRVCDLADVVPGELRGFAVPNVTWPVMVTTLDPGGQSESGPLYLGAELVAFPGVCPHDDVSLVDYGVRDDGDIVRCRVHGYRFDLRTGGCEHAPGLHLRRYRVTVIETTVYVDLL